MKILNVNKPEGLETVNPFNDKETLIYPRTAMTKKEYACFPKIYKTLIYVNKSFKARSAVNVGNKRSYVFITDLPETCLQERI